MKRRFFTPHATKRYCAGLALYLLWLWTLTLSEAPAFRLLVAFADTGAVDAMLLASGALVALNTLRAIPLYVSCFCLGEGLGRYGKILPLIAIPLSYYVHGRLTGDPGHHFGMSSIMGIGIVFCLQLLIWNVRGIVNRMLALSLFLFSFQWLNIAPALTPYEFGLGEISRSIKTLAYFSDLSGPLNMLAFGCFSIAFAGALLATLLLVTIDRNARQFKRLSEQSAMLAALREKSIQARMTAEIQTLVHDLRRPLTTIQGMADVLENIATTDEAREYAGCAGIAASSMNTMIEEIMNADSRSPVRADELLDYAMGQVSPMPWHTYLCKEPGGEVVFSGNKVRICRALVNLMENAARAVAKKPKPKVVIGYRTEGGYVVFTVSDNGPGLGDEKTPGGSGHGMAGLGLVIARKVAENHNGSFTLANKPEGGAVATLCLPIAPPASNGEEAA